METNQVLISVIIPVYNVEPYLRQCLDSIVNQTLRDIEIICIDDGSTDGSYAILQEYAQKDKRIVILQQQNSGAGIARNLGLQFATGEYIHFLDADDYLSFGAYEKMYTAAEKNNVDFLKAKVFGFDNATGKQVDNPWYTLSALEKKDFGRIFTFLDNPQKFTKIFVVPWNGIYKRSFLYEHNIVFNDLICVNDRSFYNHVLIHAQRFMFLDEFVVHYRINNQSSLVGQRGKHFECHFQSYELIHQQSASLPPEQKAVVLNAEMNDLFVWYRKYKDEKELGGKIYLQTRAFLDQLDVSEIVDYIKHCTWYDEYLDIVSDPKVTVVLTVYNAASYLDQCLNSILAQTHKNLEIICVDDGSTDCSFEILQQYAQNDTRFYLIRQENQGPGLARNTGLRYVSGEYVILLDSDDFFEPDMIKTMVKEIQREDSDMAICQSNAYSEESAVYQPTLWTLKLDLLPKQKCVTTTEIGKYLFQFTMGWAWDKLYRTSFVQENDFSFPDLKNSEDLMFVFPSLVKANRISIIHKVFVHHRTKRTGSVSNSRNQHPLCFFESSKMLKDYLINEGLYQSDIQQSYINWALEYALWNMNSLSDEKSKLVYQHLKDIGFAELDIIDKPKTYFYNKQHYAQYMSIMKASVEDYLYQRMIVETSEGVNKKDIKLIVFTKILEIIVKIKKNARACMQCYYDHGLKYTIQRVSAKIFFKIVNR